jgi:hypothetical protein
MGYSNEPLMLIRFYAEELTAPIMNPLCLLGHIALIFEHEQGVHYIHVKKNQMYV